MAIFSFPNGLPAPDSRPDIFQDVDDQDNVSCFAVFDNGEEHFWNEFAEPELDRGRRVGTYAVKASSIWAEIESCLERDKTEGFVLEINNITDY